MRKILVVLILGGHVFHLSRLSAESGEGKAARRMVL